MSQRTSRLLAVLEEQGLPAMLITSPINIAYLSGFTGSHGAVLVTPAESFVLTDSRYVLQAGDESPGFAVCQLVEPGKEIADWLVELAGRLGFDQCGFEADHLTYAGHAALAQGLAGRLELHPTAGVVEGLRMLKDAAELDAMRRAIDLTDQVMDAVLPQLRPSHTERQAAWMLEQALREGGAERPSFPIIVAAGPNAALAHHRPGDDLLGQGRPIIIDMGAHIGGYNGDLTRTIFLGEPDDRFWTIYDIVLDAQQLALAGVRPAVQPHELDALARDHITAAGFGDQFGHGLGHGIGMEVHEVPFVRWTTPGGQSAPLQAGMVTSIEPGIYLEGWGGVRIEDLVLVTPKGCEILSSAAKIQKVTG